MLPISHIAYTWLALSGAQDTLSVAEDADYRVVAFAAAGPDLIDKPLAAAYFYRRYRSAVLFAHTLMANLAVIWVTVGRLRWAWVYTAAFLGHALLDRLWLFPNTFYWPLRGWRFHVWGKRGSEQSRSARPTGMHSPGVQNFGDGSWVAWWRLPSLSGANGSTGGTTS